MYTHIRTIQLYRTADLTTAVVLTGQLSTPSLKCM